MKPISTKVHGAIDYIAGIMLLASPWILHFDRGGAETWVPVVLGAGALIYSLLTNYEAGAVRAIPMHVHLIFDFISGLFLAASPWIFGFSDYVYLPHLVFGVFEIAMASLTQTKAYATTSAYTSSGRTSP